MGFDQQRLVLAVFGVAIACNTLAAEYDYSATVLTRFTQQHNISMATKDAIDEHTLELNAGLQAKRATEIHSTKLDFFVKDDRYQNHREYEQDLRSFSLEESYKLERNQFDAKGAVIHSTTLGNSYDSGELVRINVPVVTHSLSGAVARSLTETVSVSTSGEWGQTRYDDVIGVQSQDYDRNQYGLSTSYKDAEQSSWKLSFYRDSLAQIDGLNITTMGGTASRYYSFWEIWNFTASLGRRRTQIEGRDFLGDRFSQDNYGRVSSLAIQRRLLSGALGLSASQDLSARTDGTIEDSKRIEVFWRTAVSHRLDANLKSVLIERKPISVALYNNRRSTSNHNLAANMRYLLTPSVSFDVSGRWTRRQIEESGASTQASGNAISIGLYWKM